MSELYFNNLNNFKENSAHIQVPEQYRVAGFGNLKTFYGMLEYLRIYRGEAFVSQVLGAFAWKEVLQFGPSTSVNVQFYEDFTQLLAEHGVSNAEFRAMGFCSARENLKDLDLQQVRQQYGDLSPQERSLRVIIDAADRNYHYKIESITAEKALISATPTEKVQSLLKRNKIGNAYTDSIKEGVLNCVPVCLDEPVLFHVRAIHGLRFGDPRSLFEVLILPRQEAVAIQ